jgi:Pyruvate/2-oxoacid:ferredoxin oxidoreductase delta subunit
MIAQLFNEFMLAETSEDQLYEDLRKSIDKMPVGMPATESGVEIRILKHLFTPHEAKIALNLNIISESVSKIHERVIKSFPNMEISELETILKNLTSKGSIMDFTDREGNKKYSYAMFAIGMFEFQVDTMNKDFFKDCEEYLHSNFAEEFHRTKIPQLRSVPINKTITNNQFVLQYDDIRSMVAENASDEFGVMNCICKQGMDLIGKNCKVTEVRETCILFPSSSSHFRDKGVVRNISREETLKLLDQAEKEGLVLQPGNTQRPGFICACCGDCCGVLSSAKLLPKPAQLFTTNYFASIDKELCIDCGTCVDRCQMEAIVDGEGDYNIVDLDRCIGCGLCATTCTEEAITLVQKEKTFIPPKNTKELYQKILMKKSNPMSNVKTAIKIISGRKV